MSYPVINRWGLNLFWVKFWFNDKVNVPLNHQCLVFEKILINYLNYGLHLSKNFKIHKYWYQNFYLLNYNFFIKTLKQFRTITYKNKILNDYGSYKIRFKVRNLFFSKIWFVISQKWLLINVYAFTPFRRKKTVKLKKNYGLFSIKARSSFYRFYKLKLLFFFTINKNLNNQIYYDF